jgi:hypothetical protein
MVNSQQLQNETSKFLNKEVLAVGIFDVSQTAGKRNVAPAVAGLAAGLITKHVQKKIIENNDTCDNEYTMGNIMIECAVGLATGVGTKQMMKHHDAKKNGVTVIMIVVVTKHKVYVLDWTGNHNKGKGCTKILFEFCRCKAKIKNRARGLVCHTVEITEGGHHCKFECNLGATQSKSNKKMNREVINLLKHN